MARLGLVKVAKLFKNGQSQAVRLPKELRFEGKEVYVARMGTAVVLLPVAEAWDTLFEACDAFTNDFMETREQPKVQERAEMDSQ